MYPQGDVAATLHMHMQGLITRQASRHDPIDPLKDNSTVNELAPGTGESPVEDIKSQLQTPYGHRHNRISMGYVYVARSVRLGSSPAITIKEGHTTTQTALQGEALCNALLSGIRCISIDRNGFFTETFLAKVKAVSPIHHLQHARNKIPALLQIPFFRIPRTLQALSVVQ